MPRYRLTIEYDGRGFVGWQRQTNGPSIQAALEAALAPLANSPPTVQGAGRTDAGVHALGQVAHVDLAPARPLDVIRDAANFHLKPAAIAVLEVRAVGDEFHARFAAVERCYRYRLLNRRPPPTMTRGRVWHVGGRLDVAAMADAAPMLLGRHDFTTFRAAECQATSPVKTLDGLEVVEVGEEIHVTARARSFLHTQVRSIVGSLKRVGEGAWSAADLEAALAARERAACGPVAPPDGLYLVSVGYPEEGEAAVT
ncbi:MAG: tRNA pseudouridine(38-40) synthase TruA [Alphaproteobacteria bacterium]